MARPPRDRVRPRIISRDPQLQLLTSAGVLASVLALGAEGAEVDQVGAAADRAPVLLADVRVDLDSRRVDRVFPVPVAPRDPVLVARLDVVVVRLEATTSERLELLAAVPNR